MPQAQSIDSTIRTDTYKLGCAWKPENSRWVDLQANLWRIKTNSTRHQSGGPVFRVFPPDFDYDVWYWCTQRRIPSPDLHVDNYSSATTWNDFGSTRTKEQVLRMIEDTNDKFARVLAEYAENNRAITDRWIGHTSGYFAITTADKHVLTDLMNDIGRMMKLAELKQKLNQERYDIEHPDRMMVPGERQRTGVSRTGFDISNRFRLRDNLSMTFAADYQRETLEERFDTANSKDLFNSFGVVTGMAALGGPPSAKKREWGTNLVFDWKPTYRLKIQAGIRYHNYPGFDTALAGQRAARDPRYQAGLRSASYAAGLMMPYFELADEEDIGNEQRTLQLYDPDRADGQVAEYQDLNRRFAEKNGYHFDPDDTLVGQDTRFYAYFDGNFVQYADGKKNTDVLYVLRRKQIILMNAGAFDPSKVQISSAMYQEKVTNPQGLHGSYRRYMAGSDIYITPDSV
ncbi:hypothetical protein [Neisseria gonorrhoeae]|uniref:hypothetical protein n=1 Tax=Neisseria gonorrhoeae TaxID=485 RepID=UPI00387ABDD7